MKTIPAALVIGPYTYSVAVDEAAVHAASFDAGSPLSGSSDHLGQEIFLHPDLGPDALAEVLAHEILHCLFEQIPHGLPKTDVERCVHGLAYGVLDTLRRNPDLVAFLIQEPTGPTRTGARSRHGRSNGRSRTRSQGP